MICKVCGREIDDNLAKCPYCNADVAHEAPVQPAPEAPQPQPETPPYIDFGQPNVGNQQYATPPVPPVPPVAPPVTPAQYYPGYNQAPPTPPETNKPRSAYIAALLHLFLGLFGFGYFYRGITEKGKNCIIMLIVGAVTCALFGIGSIVLLVCEVINIVEAVKLFKGEYKTDAYGRTLYQEF